MVANVYRPHPEWSDGNPEGGKVLVLSRIAAELLSHQ